MGNFDIVSAHRRILGVLASGAIDNPVLYKYVKLKLCSIYTRLVYPSVKVSASTEVTLDIPEPFRDDPWLLYPQVKLSVYTEATLYVPGLSRIALWPVYPHVKVSITV